MHLSFTIFEFELFVESSWF